MKLNEITQLLNGCTKKELVTVVNHYGWNIPTNISKAQLLSRIKLQVLYIASK